MPVKKTVKKEKKVAEPVEFKTFAIYQPKAKKFLADVTYAKTGRPMRSCSDKRFMTFESIDEAKAAFEAAECTSGYRIVELKFAV